MASTAAVRRGLAWLRSRIAEGSPFHVPYRNEQWYAGADRNAYIHRAWMRRGLPATRSPGGRTSRSPTRRQTSPRATLHLNEVAASVRDGIYAAGGIPLNLPVVSLGETLVRPTAMLWRNMAAMATEEMLRANPIDGVVLLGGCDKTIPALLMAAASVDLPAVVVPGGPMLTGTFRARPRLRYRRLAAQRGGPGRHPERATSSSVRVGDDPEPWPLQHDGHGVDHGAHRRGTRHDAARAGGHTGTRHAVARSRPTRPAGWPSSWSRRSPAQHGGEPRLVPQRHRRSGRGRRLHQRRGPSAGHRRPPRRRPAPSTISTASAPACRCLVNLQPAGEYLMEDFYRAGGFLAVLREVR